MGAAVRALLTRGTRHTFAADFASSFVLFKQNFGFWGGSYMKLLHFLLIFTLIMNIQI